MSIVKLSAKKTMPVVTIVLLIGIIFALVETRHQDQKQSNLEGQWTVCFTPSKTCQDLIVDTIMSAEKNILIQAYSFSDIDIIQALAAAKHRGVDVQIILDKSNRSDRYSHLNTLRQEHIPVKIDAPSGIAHNKVIIIDEKKVITGSYNFSNAAYKRNAENVLILSDKKLAHEYTKNWLHRWDLSKDAP